MVQSPILFLPYVRVEYARKVFDVIKRARPKTLYFFSDKARDEFPDEIARNNEIRSWIKEIDWDCDLHTYFKEKKIGLYSTIREAMQWVFDNEEYAIVLEEDCLPSLAFFDFCDQLLPKYKDDKRISIISGDNLCADYNPLGCDFIFTRNMNMYGWASWRDRWNAIKWDEFVDIDKLRDEGVFDSFYPTEKERRIHYGVYKANEKFINETKCWDFMFCLANMCNNRMAIIPTENLVSNIGVYGAHYNGGETIWQKLKLSTSDSYPIKKYPPHIIPNFMYDQYVMEKIYKEEQEVPNQSFTFKVINFLRRVKWKIFNCIGRN